MAGSPDVETWEILSPSLVTVHGHCGEGVVTTRDHHSVRVGVRYGTGIAVINNVTKLIITSQHFTLTLYHI